MGFVGTHPSRWILFYLWRFKGSPVYVGASVNPTHRNEARIRGVSKETVGKFIAEHKEECKWEILDLKVWDAPRGHYARAIENALMDFYETHKKYGKGGLNLVYEKGRQPRDFSLVAGMAARAKNLKHPGSSKTNNLKARMLHPEIMKDGADRGRHERWHKGRNRINILCRFCVGGK